MTGSHAAVGHERGLLAEAFDRLETRIAIVGQGGSILRANRAWSAWAATVDPRDAKLSVGGTFEARKGGGWGNDPAASALKSLNSVLAGDSTSATEDFACSVEGIRRRYRLEISQLEDGGALLVVRDAVTAIAGSAADGMAIENSAYQLLTENVMQTIWMADRSGTINFWNKNWFEKTRLTAEQTLGTGWLAAVHPFYRSRLLRAWNAAATQPKSWQLEIPVCVASERRFRWHVMSGRPIMNGAGELDRWVGLLLDVHEHKISERTLARSEQRALRLADSAPVMVWVINTKKEATWCNRRWVDFTGRTMEQECGRGWIAAIHPDDQQPMWTEIVKSVRLRQPFDREFRLRRADGDYRWMLAWGVPNYDAAGLLSGFICSCHDITERKAQEDRRTVLIEELNHRVKNTLAIIQSIAAQSLKSTATAERQSFIARLAALSTCHDLLTDSRWDGVSIEALIARTLAPYSGTAGQQAPHRIDGPSVQLSSAVALSLVLVLHELATNAVKYGALSTPEGNLDIKWSVVEKGRRMLELQWVERNGPPVELPRELGFGTRLLRSLARQDGTRVRHLFEQSGVRCQLEFALEPSQ